MTVAIVVILSMGVEHLNRTGWLMLNMKDKYQKMVKYSVFGIKEIILSEDNRKDIEEIRKDYIKDLKFHYVKEMIEVVNLALMKDKVKHPLDMKFEEQNKKA